MKLQGKRQHWESDEFECIFVGVLWFIFMPYFCVSGVFAKIGARMQELAQKTHSRNIR